MRNREESDGITPSINLSKSVVIIELQKKIASLHMSEREKVLEEFWHRIENGKGSPLIEKNESGDYTVTFLYRSKEEVIVELDCNDLNEQKLDKDGKVRLFDRIPDTDIYLFTIENMPGEVIVPYGFTVNKQDVQDMLNKNTFHLPLCNLGNGETFLDIRNSSVLALPNANRDLNWYKGNIVKEQGNLYPQDIEDKKQGFGERRLWIYTPPDFNVKRNEPYKLMVITDGGTYAMIMKPHLDQQQIINPILRNTVVAFVGNVREGSVNYHPINLVENETNDDAEHRQYEFLEHSEAFYEAVIAPTIETLRHDPSLHLSQKPEDTILAGFSLGGHFALESGLTHPENIGNVICLSGAFNTAVKSLYPSLEKNNKDLNIFMTVGQLETLSQTPKNQGIYHVTDETRLQANERLAEELRHKGYNVKLVTLPSGHNELSTLHSITDQALPFFCARNLSKEKARGASGPIALQPPEEQLLKARERIHEFKTKVSCEAQADNSLNSSLKHDP